MSSSPPTASTASRPGRPRSARARSARRPPPPAPARETLLWLLLLLLLLLLLCLLRRALLQFARFGPLAPQRGVRGGQESVQGLVTEERQQCRRRCRLRRRVGGSFYARCCYFTRGTQRGVCTRECMGRNGVGVVMVVVVPARPPPFSPLSRPRAARRARQRVNRPPHGTCDDVATIGISARSRRDLGAISARTSGRTPRAQSSAAAPAAGSG